MYLFALHCFLRSDPPWPSKQLSTLRKRFQGALADALQLLSVLEILGSIYVIKAKISISVGIDGWSYFHKILALVFNNHWIVMRQLRLNQNWAIYHRNSKVFSNSRYLHIGNRPEVKILNNIEITIQPFFIASNCIIGNKRTS